MVPEMPFLNAIGGQSIELSGMSAISFEKGITHEEFLVAMHTCVFCYQLWCSISWTLDGLYCQSCSLRPCRHSFFVAAPRTESNTGTWAIRNKAGWFVGRYLRFWDFVTSISLPKGVQQQEVYCSFINELGYIRSALLARVSANGTAAEPLKWGE